MEMLFTFLYWPILGHFLHDQSITALFLCPSLIFSSSSSGVWKWTLWSSSLVHC